MTTAGFKGNKAHLPGKPCAACGRSVRAQALRHGMGAGGEGITRGPI